MDLFHRFDITGFRYNFVFPKVTTADQPEDTVSSGYSVSMPGEEPVDEASYVSLRFY